MTKEQWIKIGKGALIALGGAILTYASTSVLPALDASGNAAILALSAALSVLINFARKWLESVSVSRQ